MFNSLLAGRTFVRQHDSSDCGVACLRSVLRYYGGDSSLEQLREKSGTSIQGTTLLGLYEAANKIGFDAEGCEAELSSLIEHGQPTILHVLMDGDLQHYVLWYGVKQNESGGECLLNEKRHIIGDPAIGIVELSDDELTIIWQSGKCLTLEPNKFLVKTEQVKKDKQVWLLNLLRDDAGLLVTAAILGLVMAVLGMVMAVFSQKLIDEILPSQNYTKLFSGICLVSFLLLIRIGLETLRSYILMRQAKDFSNRIIGNFYISLLQLSKSFFDSRKIGDMVARMNDTSRIQKVISQLTGQVLIDLLIVFVSIGFLFFYSWEVGVAVMICLPFYFFLIFGFRNSIGEKQKQVMSSYAMSEGNYISTLQGIRPLKSFNRQVIFGKLNRTIYGAYQDNVFSLGKIQLRLNFFASVAGVVILIGVLSFTSYRVLLNNLKAGELMAILGLSSSLLPSVASLALLAIPINEARIALDRMFEFTSLPFESHQPDSAISIDLESLEIQNITFRFPGRKALLTNVSLRVHRGEIIGIVGESGCGKSTLLQVIERFYQQETGEILVNGIVPLNSLPLNLWRSEIAAVAQDVYIFNGTILDNLLLGKQMIVEEVKKFVQAEPFFSFIASLPQGMATIVGEEGLNLSGGQKQWIGLMRALLAKPKLLLLDEATSAMDAQSERKVLELLLKLRSEMGVIYVSHRLHTLPRICQKIYVLDNGAVLASGSHLELLETKNLYSAFWYEMGRFATNAI